MGSRVLRFGVLSRCHFGSERRPKRDSPEQVQNNNKVVQGENDEERRLLQRYGNENLLLLFVCGLKCELE